MVVSSWVSSKAKSGQPSKIHGRGLFAAQPIRKGELIAVKGGHIIDGTILKQNAAVIQHSEMQLDDDLFLAPLTPEELEASMVYVNHSCDPNCVIRGDISFAAWRDIEPGGELTFDYATMHTSENEEFDCNCRAANCRHHITGSDWRIPALQEKYSGHFAPYVQEKIQAAVRNGT